MLSKSGQVYGWPHGGYPAPQGPFYCGVGSESVYGRPLAEAHMDACMKAGLQHLASYVEHIIHSGLSARHHACQCTLWLRSICRPA